eukprot:561684-Lingulodinium_polyedra.AAC.1
MWHRCLHLRLGPGANVGRQQGCERSAGVAKSCRGRDHPGCQLESGCVEGMLPEGPGWEPQPQSPARQDHAGLPHLP